MNKILRPRVPEFQTAYREASRAAFFRNRRRDIEYAKSTTYLTRQAPAFLAGRTPPDFAPDVFEVNSQDRGTNANLTPFGRSQMGLPLLAGA